MPEDAQPKSGKQEFTLSDEAVEVWKQIEAAELRLERFVKTVTQEDTSDGLRLGKDWQQIWTANDRLHSSLHELFDVPERQD